MGITDANGAYDIPVPAGFYMVTFVDPAGNHIRHTFPDEVVISEGKTVTGINASLSPAGHITGRLTGSDGSPLSSQIVNAFILKDDPLSGPYWSWHSGDFSDADGRYDLGGLEPGDYHLHFYGWPDHLSEYYADASDPDSATTISVTAGTTQSGKDAVLELGGSITGTVTGEDGNLGDRFFVIAYRFDGASWVDEGFGWGKQDGSYRVGGLRGGTYRVKFYAFDNKYATEYYNDAPDLAAAQDIVVAAGQDTAGISAQLALAPLNIKGKITEDGTNAPLPGCVVSASLPGGNSSGYAYSDSNGDYEVYGLLVPGDYSLHFSCGTEFRSEYFDDVIDYSVLTPVTVSPGTTATANAGLLRYTSFIAGTVTDEPTGIPLGRVNAHASQVAGSAWGGEATNVCGQYRAGVDAGDYIVGFYPWRGHHADEFYNNAGNSMRATPVNVSPNQTVAGIDAALVPFGTSVTGQVTGPGSAPLQAVVTAAQWNGSSWGAVTSTFSDPETGRYALSNLHPGDYRIKFESLNHAVEIWDEGDGAPDYDSGSTITVWDGYAHGGIDAQLLHTSVSSQCMNGDDTITQDFDVGTYDITATGKLMIGEVDIPAEAVVNLVAGRVIELGNGFSTQSRGVLRARIDAGATCP